MAFQAVRAKGTYDALGVSGTGNAVAKKITKRFSSEVEVVSPRGVLQALLYSGEEESITETILGSSLVALGGTGEIVIRSSVKLSNEDVAKQEVEKIKFL
jgi:hypothetical protein